MKFKFVLDVKGLHFSGSTYYRQTKDSGITHGEKKIREIQDDFNGSFNKQHRLIVYEKDDRNVYMLNETITIDPLKG